MFNERIPKIIHYCRFGPNRLPKLAIKCINSRKKYLPDYEIKLWNEQNFNVNMYTYTKQAYTAKKYAFVSDVCRIYAIYHEGGIYLDTDVEVLKSLDPFLTHTCFSGFEDGNNINPGLIFGGFKYNEIAGEILSYYKDKSFISDNGSLDLTTVPAITTGILVNNYGLKRQNTYQELGIFTAYPTEYFAPQIIHNTARITGKTYTIHYYVASWIPWYRRMADLLSCCIGSNNTQRLIKLYKRIKKNILST